MTNGDEVMTANPDGPACESHGCPSPACAMVHWIGKRPWSGMLCREHMDDVWAKGRGLIRSGLADIRLEPIGIEEPSEVAR